MTCLVGCASTYGCGAPQVAIEGDSVAPYVKIFFGSPENPELTVGNESAPQWGNTAVIKSFQAGASDGLGCKVEVLDEQGGSFHLFAEKLAKCMKTGNLNNKMGAVWGWIQTYCDGSYFVSKGPPIYYRIMDLDINFAEGKIKFILSGKDTMDLAFAARHDEIEGDDQNKRKLKQAIIELGQKADPKFSVDFITLEQDGTEGKLKWQEGGEDGPEAVWTCDGQNKLSTIQKWIKPFLTVNKKSIIMVWDGEKEDKLLLIEDPMPNDGKKQDFCSKTKNVATYIVNGGKCSPVISFNPTINYVPGFATLTAGGNTGAAGTGKTVKLKKDETNCCATPETGVLQNVPISGPAWSVFGPKNATQRSAEGYAAANKAALLRKKVIKAELRIQGDPRREYIHPKYYLKGFVALIVVNPFHLSNGGANSCGDWLAQPGCNEVLSNKAWKIMGAEHTIKEGSYVTTLQLTLHAPGIAGPTTEPFGGPGSGGYVPINPC